MSRTTLAYRTEHCTSELIIRRGIKKWQCGSLQVEVPLQTKKLWTKRDGTSFISKFYLGRALFLVTARSRRDGCTALEASTELFEHCLGVQTGRVLSKNLKVQPIKWIASGCCLLNRSPPKLKATHSRLWSDWKRFSNSICQIIFSSAAEGRKKVSGYQRIAGRGYIWTDFFQLLLERSSLEEQQISRSLLQNRSLWWKQIRFSCQNIVTISSSSSIWFDDSF